MHFPEYLVAPLLGWIAAQGMKYGIDHRHVIGLKNNLRYMYRAGGMPSTHSAIVASVVTVVGFTSGVNSAIFGVSALFAAIVIYDAMNVRYSVGVQGELLKKIIEHDKELRKEADSLYVVHGHTLTQTAAGVLVGFVVGLIVYLVH
ncbi:MAG TPA: divergent PAP2 family protein [Candidatus Saccharimonadales bacterium]|nr:divergent PAP2 family protein [Candidatus Saccharimonadales bacterium]